MSMNMNYIDLQSVFTGLTAPEKFSCYRRLWEKTGRYEVMTSFPLHLDIELMGKCNLSCDCCFQNGLIEKPLGCMEYDLFTRIIDEGAAKGLCAIKLQIRGESFLHPQLFECIRYAKDKGIVDVQITTNGTILDEVIIEKIFASKLDSIIFSIDYRHQRAFEQKHGPGTYATVISAINLFLKKRGKLNLKSPWVRVQGSILPEGEDSLQKAEQEMRLTFPDADIVTVARVHDFRGDVESYPDLHRNFRLLPCNYLMQRLAVFWNGDTTLCCMDFNNQFALGNVHSQSIEQIWNSESLNHIRTLHRTDQRKSVAICKNCLVSIQARDDTLNSSPKKLHFADCEII